MDIIEGYLPLELEGVVHSFHDMNWILVPLIEKEIVKMRLGPQSLYERRKLGSDILWLLRLYEGGVFNCWVTNLANDIITRCQILRRHNLVRLLTWLRDFNDTDN
jgi:hypothetical protein